MKHKSERVPGKNFRPLGGKPLFWYILNTLTKCNVIDYVVVDTDSEFQCEPCDREWLFRIINIYSNMIKTIKRLHIIHSWYNIGNIYDIIHETAVVKDNNKYSFFEADIKGGYNRMIKMFSEIDRPLRIKAQGDFFNIIKHGVLATENHVQLLVLSTFAQLQRYLRQNMKFTKEWYINVENVNNIVTTHECMIELPFFPRTIKRPLIDLFEALKQTDDNIEISVRKYINPMLETYKEVTIGNVKKYEGNKYMFNDGRVMSSTALAYFVNAVGYHVENDKDINFPELAETCVANARMLKFAHTQFGSDKVKSLLIAGRSLHDLLKSDFTAFELLENLLGQEHADSFLKRGRIVVNSVNGSKYVIKNDAKVYILDENGKEGSYRCVEILKGGIYDNTKTI